MWRCLGLARSGNGDLLAEAHEFIEVHAHTLGGGLRHIGFDEAGRDGVRGDTELAELDRPGLRDALDAGLGSGVVRLSAVALCRSGRHRDDAAELLFDHVGLHGLRHEESAAEVDGEDLVELLVGHLEQEVVAQDSGVVDQNGRRAEGLGDLLDRSVDRVLVGDVGFEAEGFAAGILDGGNGLVGGTHIQNGDLEPVGSEPLGDCGSDAAASTGDDCCTSHEQAPKDDVATLPWGTERSTAVRVCTGAGVTQLSHAVMPTLDQTRH